jgi:hypothetical protein
VHLAVGDVDTAREFSLNRLDIETRNDGKTVSFDDPWGTLIRVATPV